MNRFLITFLLISIGVFELCFAQNNDVERSFTQSLEYDDYGTLYIQHSIMTDSLWEKVYYEINFTFGSDTVYHYSTIDDWWRNYFFEYGLKNFDREECEDTLQSIENWYMETVPNNILDTLYVDSEEREKYLSRIDMFLPQNNVEQSKYSTENFSTFTSNFEGQPIPYFYILRDHFIPPVHLVFDPVNRKMLEIIY